MKLHSHVALFATITLKCFRLQAFKLYICSRETGISKLEVLLISFSLNKIKFINTKMKMPVVG